MKLFNFISALLPNFQRDTVVDNCRITATDIKEVAIPAFETAEKVLRNWKFKDETIAQDMQTFDRLVRIGPKGNMVVVINELLPKIHDNLQTIADMIEKDFMEDITPGGLTFMKAQMLRFSELAGFVTNYAPKYLNYIFLLEAAQYPEADINVSNNLKPAQIAWLRNNFMDFCAAVEAVSVDNSKLVKAIEAAPDITITSDNIKTLPVTMGMSKIDPLNLGLVTGFFNPIFYGRIAIADYQVARYEAAREELKRVQLQKLQLEKLAQGKPDASLQKQINYASDRIERLEYKIAQMEKR